MAKESVGVSLTTENKDRTDELVKEISEESDLLQTDRSEVIDTILTAFYDGGGEDKEKLRELLIKKQKGEL